VAYQSILHVSSAAGAVS